MRFEGCVQHCRMALNNRVVVKVFDHLDTHTWAWFLMPMTTLGLSTLLNAQRALHDFNGLYTLGVIVYILGLVEFVVLAAGRIGQFTSRRESLLESLQDPHQAMFFATFWISVYGILTGGFIFSTPKIGSALATAFSAVFWIYTACALLVSVGLHILIFHRGHLKDSDMTPAWLLPILPIILIGVSAGHIVTAQRLTDACPILFCGLLCSSMGFLFSLPMAALYLHRLFECDLPSPNVRPSMMIAIGPPTYTPLAYLLLIRALRDSPSCFSAQPEAVDAVHLVTLLLSVGTLGMACFFLMLGVSAIVSGANSMRFHLTWYGFVFPNVGLLSTLGIIAQDISSDALGWVASVGTALLTGIWIFVTIMHLRAIFTTGEV